MGDGMRKEFLARVASAFDARSFETKGTELRWEQRRLCRDEYIGMYMKHEGSSTGKGTTAWGNGKGR